MRKVDITLRDKAIAELLNVTDGREMVGFFAVTTYRNTPDSPVEGVTIWMTEEQAKETSDFSRITAKLRELFDLLREVYYGR